MHAPRQDMYMYYVAYCESHKWAVENNLLNTKLTSIKILNNSHTLDVKYKCSPLISTPLISAPLD